MDNSEARDDLEAKITRFASSADASPAPPTPKLPEFLGPDANG
jgi:hypothetical protein